MKKYKYTILCGFLLMFPSALLVLIYHMWQTQDVVSVTYGIMLKINYLGFVVSSWATRSLFESGVAPSEQEVIFFDAALVVAAMIQGCLVGGVIDVMRALKNSKGKTRTQFHGK